MRDLDRLAIGHRVTVTHLLDRATDLAILSITGDQIVGNTVTQGLYLRVGHVLGLGRHLLSDLLSG